MSTFQGPEICSDFHLQVVVLCGVPLEKQLEINDWTHKNNIPFIATETRGLFGFVDTHTFFLINV